MYTVDLPWHSNVYSFTAVLDYACVLFWIQLEGSDLEAAAAKHPFMPEMQCAHTVVSARSL